MMFPVAAISAGSMLSIAVGAVAVGVLFALHHLRVQPMRRPVATLIFWKEATRKQQARVPWAPRLIHFWTFVLLSLIGIAIAVSLSADQWIATQKHFERNAIVVDIGASMTASGGTNASTPFDAVIQNAMNDLGALPDTPAVISAGTQPALLVRPGDPLAVAKRRLAGLEPSGSASASALAINLAGGVIGTGHGTIYWYTDRSELPAGVATAFARRVQIMRQALPGEAVAIIGADFVSSSGIELSGTLHVRVSGELAKSFAVEAQSAPGAVKEQIVTLVDHQADVQFENLQANGQLIRLRIKGAPGASAEQAMTFRLPLRIPLRFEFIGSIPRPLRLALLSIGSEAAAPDANVVVAQQGQPIPANASAVIVVVEHGPESAAGLLQVDSGTSLLSGLSFEDTALESGPEVPVISQALLSVGRSVVAGFLNSAGRKTLYLSESIVGDASPAPRRAAFPVLLQRLSTNLAGWSKAPAAVTSLRQVVDPLWNSTESAGLGVNTVFETPSLRTITDKPAGGIVLTQSRLSWFSAMNWNETFLLLAFMLLLIEGFFYAAKKIV